MSDTWMSLDEIARTLGVKRHTVEVWLAHGRFAQQRQGADGETLVARSDVELWLEAGRRAEVLARRPMPQATTEFEGDPLDLI